MLMLNNLWNNLFNKVEYSYLYLHSVDVGRFHRDRERFVKWIGSFSSFYSYGKYIILLIILLIFREDCSAYLVGKD